MHRRRGETRCSEMTTNAIIESLRFEALRNEALAKLRGTPEYGHRAKLFRAAADLLEGMT